MKKSLTLKTMVEIKIISNPIRMKILRNYYAIGKPATVKQMAVHMGEVPANIHYHVKKLVEIKVLELHHTENINGITAKFYLPVAKSIKIEDENNTFTDGCINEKEIIVSNIFDEGKKEFVSALRNSKSDDEQGMLFATKVVLSDDEYNKMLAYIHELVENNRVSENDDKKEYLLFAGLIESSK